MKDWEEQLFLLSSLSFSLSYRLDGAERQGGTGIKRKRKIKNKEKDGTESGGVGFEILVTCLSAEASAKEDYLLLVTSRSVCYFAVCGQSPRTSRIHLPDTIRWRFG